MQRLSLLRLETTTTMVRLASFFVLASVVVIGFAAPTQKPGAEVMLDDTKNVATQFRKLEDALAVFPNDGVKTDHVNVIDTFPQVVKDTADKADVRRLFSTIADRFRHI
jgi:hypothetical protein